MGAATIACAARMMTSPLANDEEDILTRVIEEVGD